MESCSGENLTHDVRYQAAIQRPKTNVSTTASPDLAKYFVTQRPTRDLFEVVTLFTLA